MIGSNSASVHGRTRRCRRNAVELDRIRPFALRDWGRAALLLATIVLATGCASSRPVAFTADPGCFPGKAPPDFAVVNKNIPHFFAPLIVGAVESSLLARDFSVVSQPSDDTLVIYLDFDMIDQSPERAPRDPMGESLMLDTNLEFMARVAVRAMYRDVPR